MIRKAKVSVRYCILLIFLLTTAAVAVSMAISFLDNAVPQDTDRLILTITLWTLSLGFMLIAGAFGLWTVYFATEAESLKSISTLVDRLHDVGDAIVAIDRQGQVIAMNKTAEDLFGSVRGQRLDRICRSIPTKDVERFLHTQHIIEREYAFLADAPPSKTLRFRIQPPISGVALILVSDITTMVADKARQRQNAALQLAAHLSQGIANDFNDLLCGISGHASLLQKTELPKDRIKESVNAIQHCADRGIWLARQLTQLSHSHQDGHENITIDVLQHVVNGCDLLSSNLDKQWTVVREFPAHIPPVRLPPTQLEHIIHSLGLLIAEVTRNDPGTLRIKLHLPTQSGRQISDGFIAAILEIDGTPSNEGDHRGNHSESHHAPENGVICSLVETLIVQAGGRFEAIPDGRKPQRFRLLLPEVDEQSFAALTETEDSVALGLEAYTIGWQILICMPREPARKIETYLKNKGIQIVTASTESEFLEALADDNRHYEAIFIQPDVLGRNLDAIIPIIRKITPKAGIVLLLDAKPERIPANVATLGPSMPTSHWIHAMIEARNHTKDLSAPEPLNRSNA